MLKFEKFFIITTLCLFAGVSLVAADEGDVVVSSGSTGSFFFFAQCAIYGLLLFYCYVHRRLVLQNLHHLVRGPLPLALLVMFSCLWTFDPVGFARKGILFMLTTLFGYYLGATFKPAELSRLYVQALEIMVLLSISVIILLPSQGISHAAHSGDWRGAFYHKNRAGEIMAIAFVTFAVAMPRRLPPMRRWGLAALSLLLLYKANSSSALVAAAVVIVAQGIWALMMMKRKSLIGIVLAGYPLAFSLLFLAYSFSDSLFRLLGKNSSFTGRDAVWAGVLNGIARKPLLGYGYLAFWLEKGGNLILIAERTNFVPSHAHNGYLNLMLHVGIIGMVLFLIFLFRIVLVTIREGRRTNSPTARWVFSVVSTIIVINLTESQLLESNLFWISLIAFYTSLSICRVNKTSDLQAARTLRTTEIPSSLHKPILTIS